jgi:serine/threonine protein kinase
MGNASAAALPEQLIIAGRYRVEQLIGQGGIGAVYAVVDGASGKRLALKRLSADANSAAAGLFEREYHTLAGLKHPCIVEVYDYGSDALGAFYTMELVEGGDLSRAAPMPWREACRNVRDDAASLLGLLHARRLVHRDLTPRNLLRGPSGRLKLIDFGALAAFGPSNEVAGTPPFIPPEALRTRNLDQRSDLFSLGALAYWLVTGTHAFPARTLAELPAQWESALALPSELLALRNDGLPAIPPELDTLIASLLRREPAERLGSTAELIDRLNALADLEPESQAVAVQGYLDSKAFVGRKRERARWTCSTRRSKDALAR